MDLTGIGSLFEFGTHIVDRLIADPAQRDAAKLQLLQLQQAGEFKELDAQLALAKTQTDTNAIEAANPNVFVSGWRPGAGWCGVAALAYASIIEPMARFVATVGFHYTGAFPQIDPTISLQVLLGLLGLGGLRTAEKLKGVAAK